MNLSSAIPQPLIRRQPRSQGVASAVIARLKSLVSATTDRDGPGSTATRPYSYLSECECPDDCLRDHENE